MKDGAVLGEIHRLYESGTVAGLGDGPLLERFVARRDEAAFSALVTRLGPMVLGICRRVLNNPHDVEDAFQATFLVLLRKASSVRDRDHLAPWVYGVARRVALRARARSIRRSDHERPDAGTLALAPAPADVDSQSLRAAIDEEIGRLPEKYRAAIVLCHVEGLSHDEAARRLKCAVGTVHSRTARGRQRLRERLTRRGLDPQGATGAVLTAGSVPPDLVALVTRGALSGTVPAGASALAKGVLRSMFLSKLTTAAGVLISVSLLAGGAMAVARGNGDGPPPQRADEVKGLRQRVDTLMKRQTELEKEVQSLRGQVATTPKPPEASANVPELELKNLKNQILVMRSPQGDYSPLVFAGKTAYQQRRRADGRPSQVTVSDGSKFITLSPEGDRCTVFDYVSGSRTTFRLAKAEGQQFSVIDLDTGQIRALSLPEKPAWTPFLGDKMIALGTNVQYGGMMGMPPGLSWMGGGIKKGIDQRSVTAQKGSTSKPNGVAETVIDRLAVFARGEWKTHAVMPAASGRVMPRMNGEGTMVAFAVDHRVFAYSAVTDTWDEVKLDEASNLAPQVGSETISVGDGHHFYVFTAKTGRWVQVDEAEPDDSKKPGP